MKRENILNKRFIGYLILTGLVIWIILSPWIDIRFRYKRIVYETIGEERYTSNGLGSALFVNVSTIEGQEIVNKVVPHQQMYIQSYVTPFLLVALALLVLQLIIIARGMKFSNPVLELLFNDKEDRPALTLLFAGVFIYVAAVIFYSLYPTLYLYTGSHYYTVSEFVTNMLNFATRIPNLERLDKELVYKPGIGAEFALFLGMLIIMFYVYRIFKMINLRKTWRMRASVFLMGILLLITPIAIYHEEDTVGVFFGFHFQEVITYAAVSAIGLALILFYRFFTKGKVLIMDIQFLSLDLPADEYRKRLELVKKYSPITRIVNIIINIILFANLILAIQNIIRLIEEYNYLKYLNGELFMTFVTPLSTLLSAWLLWLMPLLMLTALLIVVD